MKFWKKYKCFIGVCALILSLSLLAGCGIVDREAQEEYRQLGLSQLAAGDYESAAESFQKALDESLGSVGSIEIDICYYKALAQFKSGDSDGAIETYTALIGYDEENADAYFLRGSAYLAAGDFSGCVSDYDAALALDASDYERYAAIYENLVEAGYEDQGRTYLNNALKQDCVSAEDYCGQGYIQFLLGNTETAEELLAAAIEKGSDQAVLYQSEVKMELGDTEAAESLLTTYLEAHPDDVDALTQAGILAFDMGEYASAIAFFEQALSIEGAEDDQELRLDLIYSYEYSADFETAYELMVQYAADFPEDDSIEDELTFLETRAAGADEEEESEEEESEQEESDEAAEE